MKKNLLSIIILALLIVNIGMTGFMLLSVMTTNSQTAKLLRKIGEISGPSKFKNTPELKADLIEKLCVAKAKSLNKDHVTNKQKEQINNPLQKAFIKHKF